MVDVNAYEDFLSWTREHSGPGAHVNVQDFRKMFGDAMEYFKYSYGGDMLEPHVLAAMKDNYVSAEALIDNYASCRREGDAVTWEVLSDIVSARASWWVWVTFLRLHHLSGGP